MLLFDVFFCFERAKVQIISIDGKKICIFVKNNSLVCSCLFVWEYLFLRPNSYDTY